MPRISATKTLEYLGRKKNWSNDLEWENTDDWESKDATDQWNNELSYDYDAEEKVIGETPMWESGETDVWKKVQGYSSFYKPWLSKPHRGRHTWSKNVKFSGKAKCKSFSKSYKFPHWSKNYWSIDCEKEESSDFLDGGFNQGLGFDSGRG